MQIFWTQKTFGLLLGYTEPMVLGGISTGIRTFLLLSEGTPGNTCAISVALASYCTEAKTLLVLISYISLQRQRQEKNSANTVQWPASGTRKRKQGRCNFKYFIILQFSLSLVVTNHFQRCLRSRDFFFYQCQSNLLQWWFIPRSRWDNLRPTWSFTT